MKRLLAWLAGALGIAGAFKALRSRPQLPEVGPDPRAEELRRRLDETKPLAAEPVDEGETAVDEAPDPPPRTRDAVHAEARAAIEEMRRSGGDEGGDAVGEGARNA